MKAVSSFFSSLFGSSPQIQIGHFQVQQEELLSEGGFGFVYQVANVKDPTEKFAMKKLILSVRENDYQTVEQEKQAKREVQIWKGLPHHPNVVQFHDMEISKDQSGKRALYILCELCPGGTLFDTIKVIGGALSEKQTVKVLTDVAMGLQHLHQRDPPIAHRDIKIENIILGRDKYFKLCDFGSATTRAIDFSQAEWTLGLLKNQIELMCWKILRNTPPSYPYLGFKVNEKVDIWVGQYLAQMLGCVAFTLITAKHPFQDQQKLAILNGQYFYPQDPPVSKKMKQFISWLFTHNPQHRPCINEVILALAKWDEHPELLQSEEQRLTALLSQKKQQAEVATEDQDFEDFVSANQDTDFSSGWAQFK